ncbi:hypothetical protein GCM10010278_67950 [Streptomyces melanogenes]|nr:hypothetical protein GCM10010278_67950 [Streptomyces melanogenes]
MGPDRRRYAVRAAASAIAQQLAELTGAPPVITEEPGAIRIEVTVTDQALSQWTRLLAVLALGTEYGVHYTSREQTAWLRIEDSTIRRPRP